MWRSLEKQDREQSKGNRALHFKCKISHGGIQHAKIIQGEAFPHPHPRRCLDQHSPSSEAPYRHLLRTPPFPHQRVEYLLSRRYPTRRPPTDPVPPTTKAKRPASRPQVKRAKFSGPGEPSQTPQAEPPTEDSQVPVGVPLETIIRRPMIAGPPIEGNLDYKIDHSTQRPGSNRGSQTVARAQGFIPFATESMTTRGIWNPTLIYFTIDGRKGIIGARHIAEALRIPYEPVTQADFMDGPHSLRGTCTWAILESPALRGAAITERTSLWKKWHHLAAYFAPQGAPAVPPVPPPQGAPDVPHLHNYPKMSSYLRPMHMPEATLPVSPITQGAPPVVPATLAPPHSSEPTITVSLMEFRG
ncbi:hypothetical protein CK203_101337 [Vitis vinifera]|uniref:Uncharacterized protein n=1 Tax=Vitis vinifera TaxID=29760 RepID=A0A438C5L2_VITVI|nr:hypothetical protein CK203_101337 [Vitis vinifera]